MSHVFGEVLLVEWSSSVRVVVFSAKAFIFRPGKVSPVALLGESTQGVGQGSSIFHPSFGRLTPIQDKLSYLHNWYILLMEEILHHLGCTKPCK